MKMRSMNALLGLVGIFSMMFFPIAMDAAVPKPTILFVNGAHAADGVHPPSAALVRRFQAKGFVIDSIHWEDVKTDTFKNYDCVVFFTFGKVEDGKKPEGIVKTRMEMMDKYLTNGGSVLVNPYLGEDPKDLVAPDIFLKEHGAAIQLMKIKDPGKVMILPPWRLRYLWTDKINRAFLGLKDSNKFLWYPTGDYKYGLRSYAFKLDSSWTPIVETDNTASMTTKFIRAPYFDKGRKMETLSGSFPIIGARKVGKGRLAVCGIYHSYTFSDPYAPALGRVFTDRGLNNKRSCGFELLAGLFEWLTADSINIARNRKTSTNKELLQPFGVNRCRVLPVRKWKKFTFTPMSFQKGAIFEIPDAANLADYIASAKKTDLKFAIFAKRTDAFKKDHSGLDAFKKICAAATDSKLIVIPGLVIKDIYGGTILITGKNIQYPQEIIFDDEKQTIVVPKEKVPGSNGELGDGWMQYVFGQIGSMRAVIASMDHKTAQYPPSDFRDYNSIVVITCEKGKVVENVLPSLLRLQNRGENLLPLALHKISAADEVANIAKRGQWIVELADKEPFAFFSRHHMLDNPEIYITSGPKIKYWNYNGARDFSNNGNPYDYSRWHFAIKLDVSSEVGLKEAIIYDGSEVFKRFDLNGKKEFSEEIPILHTKQHNLTLVVHDINGGEAVSAEIFDRSSIAEEFMCGDRNNQFFYSVQRRLKSSNPYFSRSLKYGIAPNKGPWSGESGIYSAYGEDPLHRLSVLGFDGGAGACAVAYTIPNQGIKGEVSLRSDPDRVLHTSDVAIGKARLNTGYPVGSKVSNVWHTILPVIPTEFIDATVTQTYFIPRPYDDMPVLKQAIQLTFKKPYTPVKGGKLLFRLVRGDMRDKMSWIVKSSNGSVLSGTFKEPGKDASTNFVLPFGRGAYLRMGEGSSGSYSIVSMTDGLVISERRNSNNFFIGFPNDGNIIPAGKMFRAQLLFIGEPFNGSANNAAIETTVLAFFKCDDSNLKITSHVGSMVDRRNYPIILKAFEGVWRGTVSANLAVAVPLKVTGLNPRSSGYVFFPKINKWRPLAVLADGSAYVSLPGKGKEDVVVCNPLLNDDKRLDATLIQLDHDLWQVYVVNNSGEKIDALFKINPFFTPFKKFEDVKISVPPHGSATKNIKRVIKEKGIDF